MSQMKVSFAHVSLVEHQPKTLDFHGRWIQSPELQSQYFSNGEPQKHCFFKNKDGKYFSPNHPNKLFDVEDFPAKGGNELLLIDTPTCRPQALSGPVLPNDAVSLGQPAELPDHAVSLGQPAELPDHAVSLGQLVEPVLLDDAVSLPKDAEPGLSKRLEHCKELFAWFKQAGGTNVTHVGDEEIKQCWTDLKGTTLETVCNDDDCFDSMFLLQQQYLAFTGRAVRKRKTREN
jgi:hypothetical protein